MIDTQASGTNPDAGMTVGYTPPAPATVPPTVRWVGDSYSQGFDAEPLTLGYAYLVSDAMGWDLNLDAGGGTGFIAKGPIAYHQQTALGRLPATSADAPADVVVIDVGRADEVQYPVSKIEKSAAAYLQAVRRVYPKAVIVVLEPFFIFTTAQPFGGKLARFIATTVKGISGTLIDPNGESWLPGPAGSVAKDKVHPTTAGHAYIAKHLETDFRRLGLASVRHGQP